MNFFRRFIIFISFIFIHSASIFVNNVGDGAVGKTSMLVSYTTNKFPEEHVPTVFDNYKAEVMVDNTQYTLGLWDNAGQEDYDHLRPLSYPGTDIFIVVFSVTSPNSFENVKAKWVPELRKRSPGTPFILVGSKTDCRPQAPEVVSFDTANKVCSQLKGAKYCECSSRTQEGLKQVFDSAIQCVLQNRNKRKKSSCSIM